ncbi:hypothetical protein QR680_006640 [Steinernema hermaphroditum]|uniref:Galactosylgalactosylxylosylprotein 3-beta-glucuronosyltransferase n=1 Tax=Steinernema hermaphroditum TaxID=289476 RepID=A0AA39HYJ6_9BILA|nr:hypothetical protein QR680_006640 [Steinernema hermaphroditum]
MLFKQRFIQKAFHARALRNLLKYFSFIVVVYLLAIAFSPRSARKRRYIFVIATLDGSSSHVEKLERFGNVLSRAENENILWIVSEKSHDQNDNVLDLLGRFKVPFIYLNTDVVGGDNANLWKQRQLGIDFILKLWKMGTVAEDSVVYFADVDLVYDPRLFASLENVTKAAVWPVGMMGQIIVNAPVVKNGKLTGLKANANPSKQTTSVATVFPGMAFNVKLIVNSGATFGQFCKANKDLEKCLLKRLGVKLSDFEVINNDGEVFVWYEAPQPMAKPVAVKRSEEKSPKKAHRISLRSVERKYLNRDSHLLETE